MRGSIFFSKTILNKYLFFMKINLINIFYIFILITLQNSYAREKFQYKTSYIPIKTEIKKYSALDFNQPYQDSWKDKPRVFKTAEDNNNLWKDVIKSRNKTVGYYDTEFANRINYCRYIGESIVLQKKEKFLLENVLKYMVRCNNTQQQMISHYLEKDYKDVEEEKKLSQEMISLYVEKVDEEVNEFMRDDK